MSDILTVRPRYYRWHVDPGVEWVERNTGYAYLDWKIPMSQAALVLVDVWDRHYLKDTAARAETIIREKIVPLMAACRKAGLTIIHAPSPPQAKGQPGWVRLVSDEEMAPKRDDWPPREFRGKSGDFKAYARPTESRAEELAKLREGLALHPKVLPESGEAVIATGEELHRYCKSKGILFLFYLGFNTNACILWRDYGTMEMSRRGYEIAILRDCGTGMESYETHDTLSQTRGAVLFLEMFGQYSLNAEELIAGLPRK